jgi:hypothetical protein
MAKKDPVVSNLEDIKRLLMLQLIVGGVQAQTVGKVLGISKQSVSGIIPARALKPKAG